MPNENSLKSLRDNAGKTQKEVADILGVSDDYISMLERGVRTPGFKLAKRIADLYGVSVDAIFFASQSNKKFSSNESELEPTA